MNKRVISYELAIFLTQWGLMIIGFGILTKVIAPLRLLSLSIPFSSYLGAGGKALVALILSVVWLYIWDKQVRLYFYRHRK